MSPLKDKKVLVYGLGLLGGGIATVNWLLDCGAHVTVNDTSDAKTLAASVKRVEEHLKRISRDGEDYTRRRKQLAWALGQSSVALVEACDVLVINPAVVLSHPYVQKALKLEIPVLNEGILFYNAWKKKLVGVTGTRGKTTTTHWAQHFIAGSLLAGNSMTKPFLGVLPEQARHRAAVTELSSFILELFSYVQRGPDVAIITNLYRDHLNRHGTMKEYARTKAQIFAKQKNSDHLILNYDNEWTPWFLEQKPAARVSYFSLRPLPAGLGGVWAEGGFVVHRTKGKEAVVLKLADFEKEWGRHNLANLLAAALAAHLTGVAWSVIQKKIASLPQVPYRQEVVFRSRKLVVINDTTATSPEGAMVALTRWGGANCVLICGGTDRDLDFQAWGKHLPKHIPKNNVIFLAGSATDKMRKSLGAWRRGIRTYDSLKAAWRAARLRARKFISAVILFSPGAKSFELFANEYDRGQQFNALVKRDLGER